MSKEWNDVFNGIFDKISVEFPKDKWILRMDTNEHDNPVECNWPWERFLGERVNAIFKCKVMYIIVITHNGASFETCVQECGNVWDSRRGWVAFWYWQNSPAEDGTRVGEVVVRKFGQKCGSGQKTCPHNFQVKRSATYTPIYSMLDR